MEYSSQPDCPIFYDQLFKSRSVMLPLTRRTILRAGTFRALLTAFAVLATLFTPSSAWSQFEIDGLRPTPLREFRGVWVATVNNLDFPTQPGLPVHQQKAEIIRLLDSISAINANAVLFQVRPSADAFYRSDLEPWSHWLTGEQGKAPDPIYDPLSFLIEQCSIRGFEVHAWINPYRVIHNLATAKPGDAHVSRTKPSLMRQYRSGEATMELMDPGDPASLDHIEKIVRDIVRRYDVDGVVLDDYFYPYPVDGETFPDSATYAAYGGGLTLENWRRDNINRMILRVGRAIKETKPWVRFGVSPFGIWRNELNDPEGSPTDGLDAYEMISADSRLWFREGWVDYLSPQIYWEFEHPKAPYAPLVEWWHRNSTGRSNLYISQGLYKVGTQWRSQEIIDQIRLNRIFGNIGGTVLFSARHIVRNTENINDHLRETVFQYKALPPTYPWREKTPPISVDSLRILYENGKVIISWNSPPEIKGEAGRLRFAIYRSSDSPVALGNPEGLIAVTSASTFPLQLAGRESREYFGVAAIDWNGNQGRMSVIAMDRDSPAFSVGKLYENNRHPRLTIEPNPFSQFALISFTVFSNTFVRLTVAALPAGREITLIEKEIKAGDYKARFEPPSSESSSVFNVKLHLGDEAHIRTIQRIP